MKNKIMKALGSITMLVALAVVTPATWVLIEQPETPDALK